MYNISINNKIPFPFYGAGDASYYKRTELHIRFCSVPTNQQIEYIIMSAPKILIISNRNSDGKIISFASKSFINMHIQEIYGVNKGDNHLFTFDDFVVDKTKPEFYVSSKALKAFNKELDNWLLEINNYCPIELVCRPEDPKASGIKFSQWHYETLNYTNSLLEKWTNEQYIYEQSPREIEAFKSLILIALNFSDIDSNTLNDTLLEGIFPEKIISNALNMPSLVYFEIHLKKCYKVEGINKIIENYLDTLDISNSSNCKKFYNIIKIILLVSDYTYINSLYFIGKLCHALVVENDLKLIDETTCFCSDLKSNRSFSYVKNIDYYVVNNLLNKETFSLAIRLYEVALDIKTPIQHKSLEVYCNALWLIQNNNTHLPIDKERNEKFLNKCLPYAPKNPAIYFNAVCLYIEMSEFNKAIECIRFAKKCNISTYSIIISNIKTDPLFKDFRNYQPAQEILAIEQTSVYCNSISSVIENKIDSLVNKIKNLLRSTKRDYWHKNELSEFEINNKIHLPYEYKKYLVEIGDGNFGNLPDLNCQLPQTNPLRGISFFELNNLKKEFLIFGKYIWFENNTGNWWYETIGNYVNHLQIPDGIKPTDGCRKILYDDKYEYWMTINNKHPGQIWIYNRDQNDYKLSDKSFLETILFMFR